MNDKTEVATPVLLDEKEVRTLLVNYMDHVDEYGHYGLTKDEYELILTKLRAALKTHGPSSIWNPEYGVFDVKE